MSWSARVPNPYSLRIDVLIIQHAIVFLASAKVAEAHRPTLISESLLEGLLRVYNLS